MKMVCTSLVTNVADPFWITHHQATPEDGGIFFDPSSHLLLPPFNTPAPPILTNCLEICLLQNKPTLPPFLSHLFHSHQSLGIIPLPFCKIWEVQHILLPILQSCHPEDESLDKWIPSKAPLFTSSKPWPLFFFPSISHLASWSQPLWNIILTTYWT